MSMIEFATRVQSLGLILPALLVLLKVTLILVVARLLLLAVPHTSAAAKHLGITLALCSVIAIPVIGIAVPAWRLAVFPARSATAAAEQAKVIGATGDEDEMPGTVATAITVAKAAHVVPAEKLDALSRAVDAVKSSWQGFLLIAVSSVSLLLLLRMIAGVVGVGAVARRSVEITDEESLRELDRACDYLRLPREVHLLRSETVSVPVVWGFFKPILLLPGGSVEWPAERLRVVLLHELAHVKRCDGVTLLITKAAVAMFWFHPLAWSLERIARAECERACDDLVLDSGTKPSDYAEHLLSIAKTLPRVDPFRNVTLAMSRRSQLEGRLLSILQPHVRRGNFTLKSVATVAVLSILMLVPFASIRLVAAPQPSSSTVTVVADKSEKPATFDLEKLVDTSNVLLAKYDHLVNRRAPQSGKEWYQHGYELHNHDHFREAIESFKQAIAHGYRVEDSMYNIACGYAQLDDPVNAVTWLRQAINAGYDNYSHIASDSDFDPIRSNEAFKQVMTEAPEHERHASEDRLDSATREYQELRSLPAADGEAWFSLGMKMLPLRQFDTSIEAFKQALAKGFKPATSMYNIACGYARKGDVASGLQWLQKSVEEGFDSVDHFDDDSDLDNLRSNPRFAEIRRLAEDLRLQPSDGLLGNIANAMFKNNEGWVDALPRFRAATQQHPNLGRPWFNLGFAALQAGNNTESINAFKRALDLNYRAPTTMYNIACGYARSNQADAAIQWLQKSRAAGFQLSNYIDHDNDLDNLRSDARFRDLRRQVRADKEAEKDDN
ncbi:MAG TPA: M56 family metallopeptidase [Thermoanaerobaculia bacterium]